MYRTQYSMIEQRPITTTNMAGPRSPRSDVPDPMLHIWAQRSIRPGSAYNSRLMTLHAARRILMLQIEDARRDGLPTQALEAELDANRVETRTFLAFLDQDAKVPL